MTVEGVAEVKKKIAVLKERKAKAEGVMESITKRWKEEFQCSSKEEVDIKVASLDEEIKEGERRTQVLLKKIEEAYPWETV